MAWSSLASYSEPPLDAEAHGYRDLNALMAEYGAPAAGALLVNDMSDDGQAFTGYMDNPIGAPYSKFYAVLPRAAYD